MDDRIPHEAIEAGLVEVDDLVSDTLLHPRVKEAIVERVIAASLPHLERAITTEETT